MHSSAKSASVHIINHCCYQIASLPCACNTLFPFLLLPVSFFVISSVIFHTALLFCPYPVYFFCLAFLCCSSCSAALLSLSSSYRLFIIALNLSLSSFAQPFFSLIFRFCSSSCSVSIPPFFFSFGVSVFFLLAIKELKIIATGYDVCVCC